MKEIKAIETMYNGYRFRSRLEARWAVFFNAIRMHYEYEMEGFSLPNGKSYLPDFYLPHLKVYVEIKPSFDGLTENDLWKFDGFATNGEKQLLLIAGVPLSHEMYLINNHMPCLEDIMADNFDGKDLIKEYKDCLDNYQRTVEFATNPLSDDWTLMHIDRRTAPFDCEYKAALYKARQARFEFLNNL
jgi:hypothetical protein